MVHSQTCVSRMSGLNSAISLPGVLYRLGYITDDTDRAGKESEYTSARGLLLDRCEQQRGLTIARHRDDFPAAADAINVFVLRVFNFACRGFRSEERRVGNECAA